MPRGRTRNRARLPDGRFEPTDGSTVDPNKPHKGKWYKGMPSPNPGGGPLGIRVLRERIAERTGNYLALADLLCDVAFGLDPTMMNEHVRLAAIQELLDRGIGKVKQSVDLESSQATPEQVALVLALQLSPHERRNRIAELKARAAEQPALTNGHGDADPK